ncbi:hypothetical protein Taro_014402 [Colocasia esculenta]|uniref:Aminotransferase-like plant mobile domain-containing protein n=1 Tax=Colocasia esculenta TaxID=4460 RepID=A0A843ULQ7_COLES|nr:hypothetical protein [Colocasia esculenta]
MNCKFILFLRDLEQAGRYAWGATVLGHLFSLLPSSSRRSQSTGGFTPFLQIWGYTRFPMGRGVLREGSLAMVPLMARWEVAPDPRVTDRRAEDVRAALDHYPHDQVVWTPYAGEADASHPAVAAGLAEFWLHCAVGGQDLDAKALLASTPWTPTPNYGMCDGDGLKLNYLFYSTVRNCYLRTFQPIG